MERKQFTFYRSFYEAIAELPKSEQATVLLAICDYALNGTSPTLKGTAKAIFALVKPTIDIGRKKAENRIKADAAEDEIPKSNEKQTENKTESNRNQIGKEKEKEREREKEKEEEKESYTPLLPPLSSEPKKQTDNTDARKAVLSDFCSRINPTPSEMTLGLLEHYADTLGADVCRCIFGLALDEKKTAWSYIHAVLKSAEQDGVRCLADWQKRQERRQTARPTASAPRPIMAACDGSVGDLEREAVRRMMGG